MSKLNKQPVMLKPYKLLTLVWFVLVLVCLYCLLEACVKEVYIPWTHELLDETFRKERTTDITQQKKMAQMQSFVQKLTSNVAW